MGKFGVWYEAYLYVNADPAIVYAPPHSDDEWGDIIPPYQWGAGTWFPGISRSSSCQAGALDPISW